MDGHSPSMGTAIAINFETHGRRQGAITGDFVLLGKEVNPVLKALRNNGIEVTALHSHMIDDYAASIFHALWANDDAAKLARGLRAALDLANVKRGSDRRRSYALDDEADPSVQSCAVRTALKGWRRELRRKPPRAGPSGVRVRARLGQSLIAMEYFNRSVQERGLAYRAVARGTAPEPIVPSSVREGLRTAGLMSRTSCRDCSKRRTWRRRHSSCHSIRTSRRSSAVSTALGLGQPTGSLNDYARGRDEIVRHVDDLIDELARSAAP